MADYPVVNKFLLEIIPIAASSMGDEEAISGFSKAISATFGIEKVRFLELKEGQGKAGSIEDYISNTKKPIIDNQLSDYSSFAELVGYRNKGFRSCAVIPVIANGKAVSLIELLSTSEGRFSDDLVSNVSLGASFMGFVMMYKAEMKRSLRLAGYFDAAFNNAAPQFIISNDGSIVRTNKAALRAFSLPVQPQAKISSLLALDISKLAATATGIYSETVIQAGSDGGRVYVVSASRINDNLLHVMASDSTGGFSNAALLGMIGQNNEVCTIFTRNDFKIYGVSANSEQIFGYPGDTISGGNFLELIDRTEQNTFKGAVESLASSGKETNSGAITLTLGEGGKRWMHFTIGRFLDGYLIMLVKADMEKFVESAKRDLEDFISSTSDIVFTADRLGFIRNCNMQAENVLGFKREQMINSELRKMYSDPSLLDKDIGYVQESRRADNTFIELVCADGRHIPATHSIRLLASSTADRNETYLVIIRELETKTRMEEQQDTLNKQQNEMKRYRMESELKSQFIYNMTHELRTPLTNIKGFSKLLYDGEFGTLNAEQKEYIKTTLDEADRLTLVIQQVLDAAKLEAQKVKLELKELDLKGMANNPSIKALEESARGKGLAFDWIVDYDVPPITVDPNRLIQVFVNLIGNAIKFTNKGSVKVHVSRPDKKKVKCEIIDTGIGISEDDKKKLFRRKFYEAAKRGLVQQSGAGTGLGLSITRDIVKLHGGKISFESKQGTGSTFWFTLPISPKKPKKKSVQQAQHPAADESGQENEAQADNA